MHVRRCFLEKKLILLRYVFNGILLYKRDIFHGGTKIIEQSFSEYSFVSICTSGHGCWKGRYSYPHDKSLSNE